MELKTELLTALAAAMKAYDNAVRDLIRDELDSTVRPGLEAALDQAATWVASAYAALEAPEAKIAELDEAIAYAESELASYREDLESESVSVRANARPHVNEWEQEIASLAAKRAEQDRNLKSLTAAHLSAKDALADAELAIKGYELNLKEPFYGYGIRTDAYRGFRIGSYPMWVTLLGNCRDHPEFGIFLDSLDSIAAATGYRTDDLSARLDADARERTQENFARDPEPVPAGREIVDSELTAMEVASVNRALDNSPSRIDDYRSPVVPRNAVVAEHMQVSKVPAQSRRV